MRDLSALLMQVARELQNRDGGAPPRGGPRGPGMGHSGPGRPQGAWNPDRPPYAGPGGGGPGGPGGPGGWKRGPRRNTGRNNPRFAGHDNARPRPLPADGSFGEGDHPSDNVGNREGANEGRFGSR